MYVMRKNIKKSREIEYKWHVHSFRDYQLLLELACDLGAKLYKPKKFKINDLYLDTREKFFRSSHLECRIRLSNGDSELTLKSFADPKKKIFIRHEKTVQLPHFNSKKDALKYCRNNFFRNIEPLFEIVNNREIRTLILPCGTCAEVSFDQVLMLCGKKKIRMVEIELELKSGHVEKFKAFVSLLSPLPFNPSKTSKFEEAMSHLPGDSPACSIEPLHDLTNHILKMNFEKLIDNTADFLTTFNPEAIHDMRVATRRLRAAIKIFKEILPTKAKDIQKNLKKLGCILGEKRDLDVFFEFILNAVNPKSVSFKKWDRKIDQSQEKNLLILKSKNYSRLIESLKELKTVATDKNILKVSRNRIRKKLKKVLETASSIDSTVDDKTLHKLRISIKKLRYVCEFFEPIFRKYICSLSDFIEKTKTIQEILGDHQDAIKGISMLIRYKSKFSSEEFLKIKKNYELKKRRARNSFLKIWKDYWVGNGFRQSNPITPLELILD